MVQFYQGTPKSVMERLFRTISNLRIGKQEDNPVVTDWKNQYFAGSFEKYLFQKAFNIYHDALSVNIYHSMLLVFSCDDIIWKKKLDAQLNSIFSQ